MCKDGENIKNATIEMDRRDQPAFVASDIDDDDGFFTGHLDMIGMRES